MNIRQLLKRRFAPRPKTEEVDGFTAYLNALRAIREAEEALPEVNLVVRDPEKDFKFPLVAQVVAAMGICGAVREIPGGWQLRIKADANTTERVIQMIREDFEVTQAPPELTSTEIRNFLQQPEPSKQGANT